MGLKDRTRFLNTSTELHGEREAIPSFHDLHSQMPVDLKCLHHGSLVVCLRDCRVLFFTTKVFGDSPIVSLLLLRVISFLDT